ncbi:16S rRNA (guanine(527)-N(7))-methyltransferase RsmG [bacterium]|nr:16S rRNA (guanine(527)-N(7))-methyltransferase RsmG [bacterium]
MDTEYYQALNTGLKKLELDLSEDKIQQLLSYHQLLVKWNKTYNLTSVRNPLEMVYRHLLDSLAIASHIKGETFIDVGTGGGLPGMVLAIVFPERKFSLLDSNGKKTRFLFQVKTELELNNVEIIHSRVEDLSTKKFDGVLSRAFATLSDMVKGSHQLLNAGGFFYAMKGVYPDDEISALNTLDEAYQVQGCYSLHAPGNDGERHLVVIQQA